MNVRIWVALLPLTGVALLSREASGQQQANPWAWTADSIQSNVLGQTRQLRVSLPPGYDDPDNKTQRYAVAVVLDAEDALFRALVPALRLLAAGNSPALPQLIVVGVVSGRSRMHDMFPPASAGMEIARANAGGASAFAEFMEKELAPWIRARYRTLPYTVIAGHSAAAHFALYAFAHTTSTFQAAIAISPAVFWLAPGISDSASSRDYAQRINQRGERSRLFVAFGAYDPANIRRGTTDFLSAVRAGRTLDVQGTVLPNDNHQTARQSGFVDGFRWVFEPISLSRNPIYAAAGPDRLDTAAMVAGYREIKQRYATGARSLGLPETLPTSFLSSWAHASGGPSFPPGKVLPIARSLCEDYVAWYSGDPWGRECRANVLLAEGDSLGALSEYRAFAAAARTANMPEAIREAEQSVARLDSALARRKR